MIKSTAQGYNDNFQL